MGEEDGKMDCYYNRATEYLILMLFTLFIAVHLQIKTFEALIAQKKSFLDSYNTYMKEMHESLRHNSSQTDYIFRRLIELLNDREQNRTHIQRANVVQVGQTNHIVDKAAEPRFPTDFLSTNTRKANSSDVIGSVSSHSSHQSVSTLDERPFSAPPTVHSEYQVPDIEPDYISSSSIYSMPDPGNKEDEFEISTAKESEHMNKYINGEPDKSFNPPIYDTLDRDRWNSIDIEDAHYENLSNYQFRNINYMQRTKARKIKPQISQRHLRNKGMLAPLIGLFDRIKPKKNKRSQP